MTNAAAEHLKASGVTVKPYEAVLDEVRALAGAGKKLWVDPAQVRHEPRSRSVCCNTYNGESVRGAMMSMTVCNSCLCGA